jgi:hypothetical protein
MAASGPRKQRALLAGALGWLLLASSAVGAAAEEADKQVGHVHSSSDVAEGSAAACGSS